MLSFSIFSNTPVTLGSTHQKTLQEQSKQLNELSQTFSPAVPAAKTAPAVKSHSRSRKHDDIPARGWNATDDAEAVVEAAPEVKIADVKAAPAAREEKAAPRRIREKETLQDIVMSMDTVNAARFKAISALRDWINEDRMEIDAQTRNSAYIEIANKRYAELRALGYEINEEVRNEVRGDALDVCSKAEKAYTMDEQRNIYQIKLIARNVTLNLQSILERVTKAETTGTTDMATFNRKMQAYITELQAVRALFAPAAPQQEKHMAMRR